MGNTCGRIALASRRDGKEKERFGLGGVRVGLGCAGET
jgi:hypothetical protein